MGLEGHTFIKKNCVLYFKPYKKTLTRNQTPLTLLHLDNRLYMSIPHTPNYQSALIRHPHLGYTSIRVLFLFSIV